MSYQAAANTSLSSMLSAGARRLRANDALRAGSFAALGALAAMALLVLAQRLFPMAAPLPKESALAFLRMSSWALWTMLGLVLVPLAAAAVAYARSRKNVLSAALAADERLGLRARLSSAVALEAATAGASPMSPALFADARSHAVALEVSREFPLRLPRAALFLPPALIALGLALVFVPQRDLSGRPGQADPNAPGKEDLRQVAELMATKIAELNRKPGEPRRSEELPSEKLKDDMSKLVSEMKEAADREQAIAKLNKLLDEAKLAEQRLAGMEKMVRQMEQLEKMGDKADLPKGAVEALAGSMARGDFKKASEELQKLGDKLKDGKLSDKQLGELKRDLERLAKMSGDWKELSDELAKAAAELGENDRAQALEQLAAAMEDMKELAELLKELGADGVNDGQELGQEGQRVQLTEEMIKQLKEMLKNAQRCAFCRKMYCLNCGQPRCGCEGLPQCECQGGPGGAAGLPGLGQMGGVGAGAGAGAGTGGPGQGQGGNPPENPHDVKFQTTKAPGQVDSQGQIIGHMWTKGAPTLKDDDKKAEYQAAHEAAAKAASEAVESGKIPRELREYVRNYFDTTRVKPQPPPPGKTAPEKPADGK
jgi:tetratricopeptide (TPR) repeat protein